MREHDKELWTDDDSDPFESVLIGLPLELAPGYVVCPLEWLQRVQPVLGSLDQLIVAMLLYQRCLMERSRSVALSNSALRLFGITRQTKYRALAALAAAGALTREPWNGSSVRVTLHWFP